MTPKILSSGRLVDLDSFGPDDVCWQDITAGLDVARFGGHARDRSGRPYTVAQHSCLMHDWFEVRGKYPEAALSLLHDGAEAYLGDLHAGLKPRLPEFVRLENQILEAILTKYPVVWASAEAVARLDREILQSELEHFWPGKGWRDTLKLQIGPVWSDAQAQLTSRAEKYWRI
jgi:5'-deoxynucleotidase YfbR-like HD superfamily hydrolase